MQKWALREQTETERRDRITVLDLDLRAVGDEFRLLVMSDVHFDSTMCRRDQLKADFDEALELNAPVIDCGDFFDAMQGKYDRRSAKEELRPELLGHDLPYLQAMTADAAEFLAPYAKLLTCRGLGNHEGAIRQRCEWDVTQDLVSKMSAAGAKSIHLGGYHGTVVLRANMTGTQRAVRMLKYHHGWGGGGPVTHGTIQSARMSDWIGNADLVCSGHTHHEWSITRPKENTQHTRAGYASRVSRQIHFRIPGYKDEFSEKGDSFANRKGQPPKALGAAWVRVRRLARDEVGLKVEQTAW